MRPLRVLIPLLSLVLQAGEPAWLTDLELGRQAAAKSGKPMLVYFIGSAWCPQCKLLHAEIMTSAAFETFASSRILVKLDYPPLSERAAEKVKANAALGKLMGIKSEFKVLAFPTTVILDPDGREIARRQGYTKGEGAPAFLVSLGNSK